jgi:hypothetical protein
LPFPDFLVIGAQKAGTSWLHRNLSNHPAIWTPPIKELHYFDQRIAEPSFGALLARLLGKEYAKEDWYRWFWQLQLKSRLQQHRKNFNLETALWDFRFFARSPSDRWYASLFKQGRGKITGEVTPDYSRLDESVVAHIHKLMPYAKVIFFMRNPVERVYSSTAKHLEDLKLMGQQPKATTDQQLLEMSRNPELINQGLVSETKYLRTLERWRRFYPDEQIFVGFIEDIHFFPRRLLGRLYRFLGADPSYAQQAIRRKIFPGPQDKMPTQLATHLASTFQEDLQCLSVRFGGYASFWLYSAERLISGTLTEDAIPFPLWNSQLWEEWVSDSSWESVVRSGPLA